MAPQFIETTTGNRVSRKAILCGSQNVRINGKSIIHDEVVVRGDLANIKLGKYCTISPGCVLRPAYKMVKGRLAFFSLSMGDNVVVERDSVVEASVIGSGVRIGKGCVIGKRCVIKDCALIRDGTVLAPDTVVAPFSIFEGCPGRLVGELPECTPELHKSLAQALYYESFKQALVQPAPHPAAAPAPPKTAPAPRV